MIITRSPLRISLGGGGTDVPSYYEKVGGFLIAAAIDKYVYISLNKRFVEGILLKYSRFEEVLKLDDIAHPIIRECLRSQAATSEGIEISSMADIPAGTGLGSSGSFTTALLKALHCHRRDLIHPQELAEEACRIELDILREPIGKQDQFIAAYGGVTCFEFAKNGGVKAYPLSLTEETRHDLEDNLLLFFTGYSRSASSILKEQDERSKRSDEAMVSNLNFVKELGLRSKVALEGGNVREFARLMDTHWTYKKQRSGNMSNPEIDTWYDKGKKSGALGGKLIGAGGGGFLMFYAEDRERLRGAMREVGLREVRFGFDFEGTKVVALE